MTDSQKAAQVRKMQMTDAMEKLVKAGIVICEKQIKKQVELIDKSEARGFFFAEKKMTDTVEELIRRLQEHQKTMKAKLRDEARHGIFEVRLENFKLLVTQMKGCLDLGKSVGERNKSINTNQSIIGRCEVLLKVRTLTYIHRHISTIS